MIKSPSFENYYGYQNTFTKKNTKKRMMTPKKNIFTFENSVENLKLLPLCEGEYLPIKWVNLSSFNFKIFPEKFKQETFNQGQSGLCFLFSSLSSIATIPSFIYKLFGNNDNWRNRKSFIVYLFNNNKRIEITVSDIFPFEIIDNNYNWIWSIPDPEDNALFTKIIEKAYLKYQLTYGKYYADNFNKNNILSNINDIIFGGGVEEEAMKILVNSKYKSIYSDD